MRQRQRRLPARHRNDLCLRRRLRLGPPTRRRLHRGRHLRRPLLQPRPTLGGLPPASDAATHRPRHPSPHHHVRLQHGPGVHGRIESGHVRLRPR